MPEALIVEDEPEQASVARRFLDLRGFDSVVVGTGGAGLIRARRSPPDLVLLDIMLPDVDGYEVCRRLRGDPATRLVPIVMVTAMSDLPHRRRGYRVGANAYVPKPYGPDQIFGAIDEAMRWREELVRGRVRGEIRVDLASEAPLLQEVNEFLTGVARETPLTPDNLAQLRQAILEMGQNAIEWGNRHRAEAIVAVTYRSYDDRVEVVIRDQGRGFDPKKLPHAARVDDPMAHMDVREKLGLREGGFGLMISRGMLDELRYNSRGNEVTLVKRFAAPESAPR